MAMPRDEALMPNFLTKRLVRMHLLCTPCARYHYGKAELMVDVGPGCRRALCSGVRAVLCLLGVGNVPTEFYAWWSTVPAVCSAQ